MRTPHRLYPETKHLYACELEACPVCGVALQNIVESFDNFAPRYSVALPSG